MSRSKVHGWHICRHLLAYLLDLHNSSTFDGDNLWLQSMFSNLTFSVYQVLFIYGSVQIRNDQSKQDPLVAGIPWWGILIGWIMAFVAAVQIPFWVCITIMQQSGTLREVSYLRFCCDYHSNFFNYFLLIESEESFHSYERLGTSRSQRF